MVAMEDLSGQRFGRLIVLNLATKKPRVYWRCLCDCGTEITVQAYGLKGAHHRSCGCLRKEATRARSLTHGRSKTRTFKLWALMIQRCSDRNFHGWSKYGKRGISVCERWQTFSNFLTDMGEWPTGLSLDRIDVNGPYSPENCRWATAEQQANNRRTSRFIEFAGQRMTVSQWSRERKIPLSTLKNRLGILGWPVWKALGFTSEP